MDRIGLFNSKLFNAAAAGGLDAVIEEANNLAKEVDELYLRAAYHEAMDGLAIIKLHMTFNSVFHPRPYFIEGFLLRANGDIEGAKRAFGHAIKGDHYMGGHYIESYMKRLYKEVFPEEEYSSKVKLTGQGFVRKTEGDIIDDLIRALNREAAGIGVPGLPPDDEDGGSAYASVAARPGNHPRRPNQPEPV